MHYPNETEFKDMLYMNLYITLKAHSNEIWVYSNTTGYIAALHCDFDTNTLTCKPETRNYNINARIIMDWDKYVK